MSSNEWYLAVAKAISKRDHAINMVDRWTTKVQEAETEIADLTARGEEAVAVGPAPEPAPVQE